MRSRMYRAGPIVSLVSAFFFLLCAGAQAQELEGTWELVMRKLPDGTTQVPPAVQGLLTYYNGRWTRVVIWQTPQGKTASFAGVSAYKMAPTAYTETLLFSVFEDGSGKPAEYNLAPKTKSVPVTREGGRASYKAPFDPPVVVIAGDKITATAEGKFVDYWERVR